MNWLFLKRRISALYSVIILIPFLSLYSRRYQQCEIQSPLHVCYSRPSSQLYIITNSAAVHFREIPADSRRLTHVRYVTAHLGPRLTSIPATSREVRLLLIFYFFHAAVRPEIKISDSSNVSGSI